MIGVSEIKLTVKFWNNNTDVNLTLSTITVHYIEVGWFQKIVFEDITGKIYIYINYWHTQEAISRILIKTPEIKYAEKL